MIAIAGPLSPFVVHPNEIKLRFDVTWPYCEWKITRRGVSTLTIGIDFNLNLIQMTDDLL